MYNTEIREGESVLHYYRRLAKVADQRLVRLEALSHEEHYKGVNSWAYNRAMYEIKSWSGKEATRFNTKPPENVEELWAKINDIRRFIEMPTSSKAEINKIYRKKATTLNKNYGTDFTWEDLASFYERETNKLWDKKLGYKTALYTIGAIQKNADEIKEGLKEAKSKNKDIKVVKKGTEVSDKDKEKYAIITVGNLRKEVDIEDIEKALTDDNLTLKDLGI